MKKSALERVEELSKKLSPQDRKLLFHFLAELPDSGIQTGGLDPPAPLLSPEDRKKVEERSARGDNAVIVATETSTSVFLKKRPIFQIFFYRQNYFDKSNGNALVER